MNNKTTNPTHYLNKLSDALRPLNLYSDGAAPNNQAFCWRGGFGVVAYDVHGEVVYEYAEPVLESGGTTNNRTELLAFIHALMLAEKQDIIHSDSEYVVKGYNERMVNWKAKGWRTAAKKPIANLELWKRIDELKAVRLDVKVCHVKGHAGVKGNERANELAAMAA